MKCKVTQAGAGTGKTTSLINEVYKFYVEYRSQHNKHPNVVLTTFTRKATQELRERIVEKAILEKKDKFLEFALSNNNLHISTIHGIVSLFLRQYAEMINIDPNFKVMNQSKHTATAILRDLLNEDKDLLEDYSFEDLLDYILKFYKKYSEKHDIKPATKKDLEEFFQNNQDKKKQNKQNKEPSSCFEKIEQVGEQFNKLGILFSKKFDDKKQKDGKLTIDDLELLMLKCIRNHKNLVKEFSSFWNYWLIDEYQDTSPLQDLILDNLSQNTKCFYVGDPQQSIYSFRDAKEEVFLDKLKFCTKVPSLKNNYRSNGALVSFFNDFFGSHKRTEFVSLGSKSNRQIPNYPVCTFVICEKDKTPQEEVINNEIKLLLKKGVQLEDICVLCHKNDQLAEISKRLDVPTFVHSSGIFHKRKEIKDLKIIMKFLINPHDNINFISFLRMPWITVGEGTIFQIGKSVTHTEISYWHYVKNNPQFKDLSHKLEGLLNKASTNGISDTVRDFCVKSGFIDDCLLYDDSGRREANIWKFLLQIKDHEAEFNFLNFIEEEEDQYSEDTLDSNHGADAVSATNPGMVNLMTIHKAKGLEFKHVFIAFFDTPSRGNSKNTFVLDEASNKWTIPYNLKETNKASVLADKVGQDEKTIKEREKDRMLYVAMTRAIDSLHIFIDEKGLQEKGKTSGYWVKNFDWDFAPSKVEKDNYTYEIRKAKVVDNKIDLSSKSDTKIPDKLTSNILVKKAVGDFLENKVYYSQKNAVLNSVRKTDFGIKFHRVMQLIQSGAPCNLKVFFDSDETVNEVENAIDFLKNLKSPPFIKIFETGQTEWWFMKKLKHVVLEGRIDLWGVADDIAWVIDYKTGSPENHKLALKQLAIYASMVKDVCKREVKIAAVYPMDKEVIIKDSIFVDQTIKNLGF